LENRIRTGLNCSAISGFRALNSPLKLYHWTHDECRTVKLIPVGFRLPSVHSNTLKLNHAQNLADVLESRRNEIHVDTDISRKALICIDRMLSFAAQHDANVRPSADLAKEQKLFSGIGPA
jgi:hypothetical protein